MLYVLTALVCCFAAPVLAQLTAPDPYYQDTRERFQLYIHCTYTDPARLGWLLVDSATATWSRDPQQWDRSAESYSYRVASGWGRRIVRNTAMFGLESVLHEDSRYRPSNEHGVGRRMLFAIRHSVLAYKPDGSVEPAFGRIAAGMVVAAVSSTWHPQSIEAPVLLRGVGDSILDRAENNLLTEFEPDLIAVGKKAWNRLLKK